jgi:replication fork clamp-binding protein CrfC
MYCFSMEASYINTGHPDFISGHKAMALIHERLNASKPPTPTPDPKTGKLPPGAVNNNKDLDVDLKQESGFFGSFFSGSKAAAKKKGAAMEPPPPVLKASGTLSEREQMECDVIKLLISSCELVLLLTSFFSPLHFG